MSLGAAPHPGVRELIAQHFAFHDEGVPRLHRGTRSDRIISVIDPEMRHGRKSRSQRFDGYKIHAAATNTAEPLITAVDVTPGGDQDGPQAPGLVDQQPRHRRPPRLLGDTAYGTGPVRAELACRDTEVLAPVPDAPIADGRLGKRDFEIDLDAGTVTCPAGQVTPIRSQAGGKRRAVFRRTACRECPLGSRCLAPRTKERSIWVAPEEQLLQAGRRQLDDPATAEHLRRTRPRIERLLGLLAARYGARKSRYLGRRKAALQAAWSAALVNLNPVGRVLATQSG